MHAQVTTRIRMQPGRLSAVALAALLLAASGVVHAQTGAYRIAGTVVNAVTGDPVQRAVVAVLQEADSHAVSTAVTDSEGHFALAGLAAAKYQLTASRRGYLTGFYDQHEEFNSAIVTGPGEDTEHLTFRLSPDAVLQGMITDDGGDPVQGARVMLFERPRHPVQGAAIVQANSALTDDTGAYEFGDLEAGTYLLAVLAEPWYAIHTPAATGGTETEDQRQTLDVAYPVTYYDSTTDEGSATPVTLTAGDREEADISLRAVPTIRVSVPAPARPGADNSRADLRQMVFGTVTEAESTDFTQSQNAGSVTFGGLAPGHYELSQGNPPQIADLDLSASEQVNANAGVPVSAVTGTLRLSTGQAATGDISLTLARTDAGRGQREFETTAHNGQFRFDTVPAGAWSLGAHEGDKPRPVLRMAWAKSAQAGNAFTVDGTPLQLRVTLSNGETRVMGMARKDGKGFAGAMVLLAPRDPAAWPSLERRDQSDSDGSFALRDVAAGQYTLVAIEHGWDLDWQNAATVARYLARGVAVTVPEGAGATMRLDQPVTVQSP